MRFADVELRTRVDDDERVVELDGYHRPQPESKPGEYRRVALVDLTEAQARALHEELGEVIEAWDDADESSE